MPVYDVTIDIAQESLDKTNLQIFSPSLFFIKNKLA